MSKKRIIWSNYCLDYDDWKADLEEQYPDLSEDERISLMHEINNDYLGDERMNLNIQLDRPILVIGDLGLWNGRRSGYKEIESGNIRDCLFADTDYSTWYVDKLGDLRCDAIHHDGTNHYLYRVYKDGVSESQIDLLKEKIYYGTATRADITRVTCRLGDVVAKVYGFSIPRHGKARNDCRAGRRATNDRLHQENRRTDKNHIRADRGNQKGIKPGGVTPGRR